MSSFRESFGEAAIDFAKVKSNIGDSFISSGSRALNLIITGNSEVGIARRRIYEIYGLEGCGKTTLGLEAIASCQKQDGKAILIDAEHGLDPMYAKSLGIKLHTFDVGEPDCGEYALEMIEWAIESGYDLAVVDSVAAMVPQVEVEGNIGDVHMGLQARLMGQGLRRITSKLSGNIPTSIIFINQIRMKIGVMFGNPETTSGGLALRFFSSVRIDLRDPRGQKVVENKEEVGKVINAKTVKNKIYSPFKRCKIHLTYGHGIDEGRDCIQALSDLGWADFTKSTVSIKGFSRMNYDTFLTRMKKDKGFNKGIKDLLKERKE